MWMAQTRILPSILSRMVRSMGSPLATQADVEAIIGRPLTETESARCGAILVKLSAQFRRIARQDFSDGTSTNRLKVNGGTVVLSQRPVTSVTSVVDDSGAAIPFVLRSGTLLVSDPKHPEILLDSSEFVTVTYSHGGDIPDVVVQSIADTARSVLQIDPDASSGKQQSSTTTGPFNEQSTFATWAQGGKATLSPDDVALAKSYRIKAPAVWVARPC